MTHNIAATIAIPAKVSDISSFFILTKLTIKLELLLFVPRVMELGEAFWRESPLSVYPVC